MGLPVGTPPSDEGSRRGSSPQTPPGPAALVIEDVAQDRSQYQQEPAGVDNVSPAWRLCRVTVLCPFRCGTMLHFLHSCLFWGQFGAWPWLQAAEHAADLLEAALGLLEYIWNRGNRQRSGGTGQDTDEGLGTAPVSAVNPAGRPTALLLI